MSDREMDPQVVRQQVGIINMMSISGGRLVVDTDAPGRYPDILLPVSSGYRVRITLDASDTYTVTREMKRGAKLFAKGVQSDVYCMDLGEVCYQASSYKSNPFGDHAGSWYE